MLRKGLHRACVWVRLKSFVHDFSQYSFNTFHNQLSQMQRERVIMKGEGNLINAREKIINIPVCKIKITSTITRQVKNDNANQYNNGNNNYTNRFHDDTTHNCNPVNRIQQNSNSKQKQQRNEKPKQHRVKFQVHKLKFGQRMKEERNNERTKERKKRIRIQP